MAKPTALTPEQLAYCRLCLKNRWPWLPHKEWLIEAMLAMAEERNEMCAEKAKAAGAAMAGIEAGYL